jgi:hypothetical protein
MVMEERNKLFNTVPAGDGFAFRSATIIGNSNRAIANGGYSATDSSAVTGNNDMWEFDLTNTSDTGSF